MSCGYSLKEYVASIIGLYKNNGAVLCVGINFVIFYSLLPCQCKVPTVDFVELWTVFYEYCSLLGRSSNLAYPSSYTHFIVSIIPRNQL